MLLLLAVNGGASALFGIAAFWQPASPPWNRLVAAGLFFTALAQFIVMVGGL